MIPLLCLTAIIPASLPAQAELEPPLAPPLRPVEGVRIDNIEMIEVEPPIDVNYLRRVPREANVGGGTWLLVEVAYTLNPSEPPLEQTEWLDQIELRFHVLSPALNNNDARQLFSCVTRLGPISNDATERYMGVLLPPNWVARYGGFNAFRSEGNAAVEVHIGGTPIAEREMRASAERGVEGWWLRGRPVAGAVRPYTETPFYADFARRYFALNQAR